ncbi:hypothetical protein L596_026296 [Steinernema carpocapsae]|uniref:Uncharacterized protein n=1 Tax=Steinernema carpocapsae TaxID=34508 RepID=A0A4U5M0X5_STECR|nr:hypothetical protein L596_026296 [Steinernema carpocapsae]
MKKARWEWIRRLLRLFPSVSRFQSIPSAQYFRAFPENRFKTVESLKRALQKAWKEISPELTIRIVDQFPKRLQACINAEGINEFRTMFAILLYGSIVQVF